MAEEAARVGLRRNVRSKTLTAEFAHSRESIVVNGEEVEDVVEFARLGDIVDKEDGGSKDIMYLLQKALVHSTNWGKYIWAAFSRLWFDRSCYMTVKHGRLLKLVNETEHFSMPVPDTDIGN